VNRRCGRFPVSARHRCRLLHHQRPSCQRKLQGRCIAPNQGVSRGTLDSLVATRTTFKELATRFGCGIGCDSFRQLQGQGIAFEANKLVHPAAHLSHQLNAVKPPQASPCFGQLAGLAAALPTCYCYCCLSWPEAIPGPSPMPGLTSGFSAGASALLPAALLWQATR